MTTGEKITKPKLGLLKLAQDLSNIVLLVYEAHKMHQGFPGSYFSTTNSNETLHV
jgi:hypothetical protein